MRVFLCNQSIVSVNEVSQVEFTGTELRLYFNKQLISSTPASPGECFYVQPNGLKKFPTITKAVMPESRGKKIAWALDFVGDKKFADSFDDFQYRYFKLTESKEFTGTVCSMKVGEYGFLLAEKRGDKSPMLKPILAWISDDITEESLYSLVDSFIQHRRMYCGVDFLKLL